MKLYTLTTIGCLVLLLSGCGSYKQVPYLQDLEALETSDTLPVMYDAKIMPKDLLTITVNTSDPEASAPFNLTVQTNNSASSVHSITQQPSLQQYLVNNEGDIDFPVLGKLYVVGLRQSEVISLIEGKLQGQVVNPIVTMRFLNARVTVLGEVKNPGTYTLNNGRMTLLEALGIAGDLTQYASRRNVLVTRENNGKVEFARLDLRSDEVFTSPYFYLQQNDVVYVEPNSASTSSNQSISLWLSMVGTVASAATVVVSVLSITK